MALTDLTVIWLGSLATLATMGMFYRFVHVIERAMVTFGAAVMWGLFALASTNVLVASGTGTALEPMWPLAWLGIGMAAITGLYGFYDVLEGARSEASNENIEGLSR